MKALRLNSLALSLAAVALACGCSSTAPRTALAPETLQDQLQNYWSGEPDMAAAAVSAPALAWWRVFHDPALDALIARAEARNLDLQLAEARIAEARALRAGAGAALAPRTDVGLDLSRGRSLQIGSAVDNASASVTASWELDLFGQLRATRRAAVADLEASQADRDALRLVLLAEVARGYLDYRLYGSQQQLLGKTAQAQADTLRITRARYGQGVGSRLDVERATALLATTSAQIPQAREQRESAFHRLVLLTADTPDALRAQLPEADAASLPDSDALQVLSTPTQVLAQRPDVRAAERRMVAANERLAASRALRYPQLNLSALLGVQSRGDLGDLLSAGTRTWSVGGGLLAPLFDFGRIRAGIDAADARQQQSYLQYELVVRTALQEAQTALLLYTEGKLRQQQLQLAVDSARVAAQLARRQYGEGALSLLEVLDAERSLYNTELAWSQATVAVSTRLVSLYQTMGIVPPATPPVLADAGEVAGR